MLLPVECRGGRGRALSSRGNCRADNTGDQGCVRRLILGLFIRSLIGLDRGAAKQAFASLLSDGSLSADQIEFLNMVIDHLTERGVMDARLLYESPFTDRSPLGIDGVLGASNARRVIELLDDVRKRAAA